MNRKFSLKSVINSISNEKGLTEKDVIEAIKEAILHITKKKYKKLNVDVFIDKETGYYKTYAIYNVIENIKYNISIKNSFKDIPLNSAKIYNNNLKIGDKIKKEIESIDLDIIDVENVKKIINEKIKIVEKGTTLEELEKKNEKIVTGIIKKIYKELIIVDIGIDIEGIIKKSNLIPGDLLKIGDKIKAYIVRIIRNKKNAVIQLSRSCDEIIISLLKLEIPEISEGLIKIKHLAREPGVKSKISVQSLNPKINPIGACVGIKGTRIQNISKEFKGEKLDFIIWNDNITKYLENIIYPIKYTEIKINEKDITLILKKEDLSKIIGKNGQNIKLIKKLIKYELNIKTNDESN